MFQFNSVEPLLLGPKAGGNIKAINYGLYFGTPYTYSLNNPVKYVDADGNFGFLVLLGIAAGALLSADYANAPGPVDVTYSMSTFEYVVDTAVPALMGMAAGGAIDRSIQSEPADAIKNGCPNPDGRKGGPAHQRGVEKAEEKAKRDYKGQDVTIKREGMVNTPGGQKNTRFGDVTVKKDGSPEKVYQVGDVLKDGKTPIKRERDAIKDIKDQGVDTEFIPKD